MLSRTLISRDPVRADGDSGAFILPQTLNNARTNELGVAVDFARAAALAGRATAALGQGVGARASGGREHPAHPVLDLRSHRVRSRASRYQLALGGLESFLRRRERTRSGVSDSRTATVASGADLPYGVSFTLSHALTRTTRFQRVGEGFVETESNQREWPVGNVRWSHTFRAGALTLLAIGTAFRHREGTLQSRPSRGGTPALTNIKSSSITPDVQFGSATGCRVSLGVTRARPGQSLQRQPDPAGPERHHRLAELLVPAAALDQPDRKQVRSSLTVLQTGAKTCLRAGRDQEDCIVISDVPRQEVRGGLDTDLLQTLAAACRWGIP